MSDNIPREVFEKANFAAYALDAQGRYQPLPPAAPCWRAGVPTAPAAPVAVVAPCVPVDKLRLLRYTLRVEGTPPDMADALLAWAQTAGVARAAQGLRDWQAFARDAFVEEPA